MKTEHRFVFDTNVIVSALLCHDSVPARAFFLALQQGTVLISADLVRELSNVLGRRKFRRYITLEERDRFLVALVQACELVDINRRVKVCRDPRDDHILELALNGQASSIITGDRDLLTLGSFHGTEIVTPRQFLQQMDAGH